MNNLLRIKSSLFPDASVSNQLSDELLEALREAGKDFAVVERDFNAEPIPHLDAAWVAAIATPADQRSAEQQERVAFSDTLIQEVLDADTLVLNLPMYNFTVPSMMKAWIDHVARAGTTFAYTQNGPKGLLRDKKVYVVVAMGGLHEPGGSDFLRPYIKQSMAFIGLDDVEFVAADGLNMGEQPRAAGIAAAREQIANLVAAAEVEEAA